MHLSFNDVCNKEHKGVICIMISSSKSSQSTRPVGPVLGKNYSSFLDFTRNYEPTCGFFVPCKVLNYLKSLGKELSLQQLTYKTVVILLLLTAQRCQFIHTSDPESTFYTDQSMLDAILNTALVKNENRCLHQRTNLTTIKATS